jgi:hypothetical protein
LKFQSFHNSPGTEENRVKIRFDLVQDADGYPPATAEYLWASELGGGRYQIDNIPFFVIGVSCFDIVSALKNSDGVFCVDRLLEERGHSTIRVILLDHTGAESIETRSKELRSALKVRGCSTEQSHIPGLISLDVPPEVDFQNIRSFLQKGSEDGLWDFEEAAIAHAQS